MKVKKTGYLIKNNNNNNNGDITFNNSWQSMTLNQISICTNSSNINSITGSYRCSNVVATAGEIGGGSSC